MKTFLSPKTTSIGGTLSGGGGGLFGGGEAVYLNRDGGGGEGDLASRIGALARGGNGGGGGGGGGERRVGGGEYSGGGDEEAAVLTDVEDTAPVTPKARSLLVKPPMFPGSAPSSFRSAMVGGAFTARKSIVTRKRTPPVCTVRGLPTRTLDACVPDAADMDSITAETMSCCNVDVSCWRDSKLIPANVRRNVTIVSPGLEVGSGLDGCGLRGGRALRGGGGEGGEGGGGEGGGGEGGGEGGGGLGGG